MAQRVGIIGAGLIGHKRAAALDTGDTVVAVYDVRHAAAAALVETHGGVACTSLDELFAHAPDIVVVATTHDQLSGLACAALAHGAHVLVEKPAGLSAAQIDAISAAAATAGRRVKVGFNHRFHPGIRQAIETARSGEFGEIMHMRGRYGHGGRVGYDKEWRADVAQSGGGEIVDQGMHLLDLSHWLLGDQPLHSALVRTQFWDTEVDDNAVLVLGERASRSAPWSLLHVTWTEWKNLFSLEIYCRTAKLHVEGLVRSYGPQRLTVYRMAPELGPPEVDTYEWPDDDQSWAREWKHFVAAIDSGEPMLGELEDARYAWEIIDAAYRADGYGPIREGVG
jgi:predicted dehydrogenase